MSEIQHPSVLSPVHQGEDLTCALRPQDLEHFIGQAALKSNLSIFIQSAKLCNAALDHVLLVGPPGLGKTTLAQIIAKELGVSFHSTSGPVLTKAGDLAALLTNLQTKDVLFIDEIHRLSMPVEELLYPAMEDFQLDLMLGEGPAARSIKIDLSRFTLVGATTRSGLLSTPLRDRFGIPIRMEHYQLFELMEIILRQASLLNLMITDSGARSIALRSRGTPRIAIRLLRRVRDFAIVKNDGLITEEVADHAMTLLHVDPKGLDLMDLKYLKLIAEAYEGGPVGLDTLSAALSEPRDTIEEVVEPYLIQQGFIFRTPRGRVLTQLAQQHLKLQLAYHEPI